MSKNSLDFRAQLSRHSHDLSAPYKFSMPTGPIIPTFFHIMSPGDTMYISSNLFVRMQDVVTAFLGEIDFHLDYFFVPLQMLYTPFGQQFALTNDWITDTFGNHTPDGALPVANLDSYLSNMDQFVYVSGHEECLGKETARLLDALDFNPLGALLYRNSDLQIPDNALPESLCKNGSNSVFIPAAYQAIYQKYPLFRNDSVERLDVFSYNYDTALSQVLSDSRISKLLRLRYIGRPNDYFTETRPSPIASAINAYGFGSGSPDEVGSDALPSLLSKVNSFLTSGGSSYPFSVNKAAFGEPLGPVSNNSAFNSVSMQSFEQKMSANAFSAMSAANIRALFAVDKFVRIWGRADKTYDDQILAHFGYNIPHDVKHDITHINHYHVVLGSQPVYASQTNQSADGEDMLTVLGQVGGQASCQLSTAKVDKDNSPKYGDKFEAPVHGVFMAVVYAVRKPSYQYTFSKLHKISNRLDLPIPEFDKLGAQPLYGFEFNPKSLDGNEDKFFGWQNRYQQYKKKYPRVSITFSDPYYRSTPYGGNLINVYSPWVISQPVFGQWPVSSGAFDEWNTSHSLKFKHFFESPHGLNHVMARPYTGNFSEYYFAAPWEMFQNDPFICDFYCDAKLVSWMSETGEPDL